MTHYNNTEFYIINESQFRMTYTNDKGQQNSGHELIRLNDCTV
jgi:hypothetical protein